MVMRPPGPPDDPDATVVRPALPGGTPCGGSRVVPRADPDATVVRPWSRAAHAVDPDATVVVLPGSAPPSPPLPEPRGLPLALAQGFRLLEYEIQRVLGQGGFGITYLATDVHLNAKVAIKEYLPEEIAFRAGDHSVSPNATRHRDRYREGLESFLVEARTLASFRHPAIVRVARFFEAHRTAYMVLEYEQGSPLKAWWPRHADKGEAGLIELLLPLLDGLAIVHEAGFLHRDIKPDNIQVRQADGRLVLLDFGSAGQTVAVAGAGAVVLTPGYAPLEQYGMGQQGAWTDLYALGATLYWCVTGSKPPDAEMRSANPRSCTPAVQAGAGRYGQAFLEAIDWALTLDTALRPQTVAELRRALCADHVASLDLQDALAHGDTVDEIDAPPQESRWHRALQALRRGLALSHQPTAWPLALKMTLAMLATALLPMAATGLYNLRIAKDTVAAGELRFVEQMAVSTASRISQFITDNRHLARMLGTDTEFTALVTRAAAAAGSAAAAAASAPAADDAFNERLKRTVEANPDVQRLSIADREGRVLASSDPAMAGLSFAGERAFQEALQGRSTTSGLQLGLAAPLPGVLLAQPVAGADGTVLGVLVLRLRGSSLAAIVDEVRSDPTLTPILIDRDGVVLHHLQEDLIFHSLVPLPAAKQAEIKADQRFRLNRVESLHEPDLADAMVNAQMPGHVAYHSNIDQREAIAGYAPVTAHEWVVGVTKSRTDFESPLLVLVQQLQWSGALIGLLFTGLALRFARSIVRPIRALTAAANALKSGQYDTVGVEVQRKDELGQLGRTFNVMIDVLRQRERERRRG
jgi:serine/threonine protein kinase/HAMP domain-containing protein